jgi:hypothetical protein
MLRLDPRLRSRVAPALLLLFGLVFCFALAHLTGAVWVRDATCSYYAALFLWAAAILLDHWRTLGWVINDCLFIAFVSLIIVSLAWRDFDATAAYYAKLLPFMVLMPYVLGRVVGEPDFAFILGALSVLGILLLAMCALEFWPLPNTGVIYSRWTLFGFNHASLLIAQLVAISAVTVAYRLVVGKAGVEAHRWDNALGWLVLGIFTVALVLIAARGALIGCVLAFLCLLVLARCSWVSKAIMVIYLVLLALANHCRRGGRWRARIYRRVCALCLESAVPRASSRLFMG